MSPYPAAGDGRPVVGTHQIVLAVLTALPFLIAVSVSPASTFFNQALAVVAGAVWLLGWAWRSKGLSLEPLPGATRALLVALGVLAAAMLVPGAPIGQRLLPMACVLLALLLVQAAASAAQAGDEDACTHPLMMGLLIGGVASLMVGLIQVFAPEAADGVLAAYPTIAGRAVGNMRQPNQLSTLLLWAVAAVVWLGVRRRWTPQLMAGLIMALVFGVAATASRTGTVGVLLLVVWGVIDRRLPGRVRLMLVLTLPAYVLSWWGLEQWLSAHGVAYYGEDQLKKTFHGDASSSRGRIWANAWALIQAQPWFGTGVGAFNFEWTMTPFPDRPVAFFDHTHNLVLQLAVEYGLPLTALVLGLGLWSAWAARGGLRAPGDGAALSARTCLFMLVLVGVHSLLEYPLWYVYFLVPTAVMAGTYTGLARAGETLRVAMARPALAWSRFWAAAGALTLAGITWTTVQYLQVAVIFEPDLAWQGEAGTLEERIARGRESLFFGHHADYAQVTMAAQPQTVIDHFERPLYHLLDTRLMLAYAKALAGRGDLEGARHIAARLREFHNPASEEFLGACEPAPAQAASAVAGAASAAASNAAPGAPAASAPFQCGPDPQLSAQRLIWPPAAGASR